MLRRSLALVACAALAACATDGTPPPEPKIITQTVKVPVPTPCPDKREPKPLYVDTLAAIQALAGKPDALVALLLGGRTQRIQREDENEAQIAACGKPPPDG